VPVAATSCHGLPRGSPYEVPTLVLVMGNGGPDVRAYRKAALQALPASLQARGPAVYAEGTFATKADGSSLLANPRPTSGVVRGSTLTRAGRRDESSWGARNKDAEIARSTTDTRLVVGLLLLLFGADHSPV